eukprot:443017-Rhodomonas_salina.2
MSWKTRRSWWSGCSSRPRCTAKARKGRSSSTRSPSSCRAAVCACTCSGRRRSSNTRRAGTGRLDARAVCWSDGVRG